MMTSFAILVFAFAALADATIDGAFMPSSRANYSKLNASCVTDGLQLNFVGHGVYFNPGLQMDTVQDMLVLQAAGVKNHVVYGPCNGQPLGYSMPWCGSADDQIGTFVRWLRGNGTQFERLWIDLDFNAGSWKTAQPQANLAFLIDLIAAVQALRVPVGIYGNDFYWGYLFDKLALPPAITGSLPVWFTTLRNSPNIDADFKPFGGFKLAQIESWTQSVGLKCGRSWFYAISR